MSEMIAIEIVLFIVVFGLLLALAFLEYYKDKAGYYHRQNIYLMKRIQELKDYIRKHGSV